MYVHFANMWLKPTFCLVFRKIHQQRVHLKSQEIFALKSRKKWSHLGHILIFISTHVKNLRKKEINIITVTKPREFKHYPKNLIFKKFMIFFSKLFIVISNTWEDDAAANKICLFQGPKKLNLI